MWEPWRGSEYKAGGVLILGESCYDWEDREGGWLTPEPDHPSVLVRTALKTPLKNSRLMVTLTRAITRTWVPTPETSAAGWNRVAFTNYIPTTVGEGAAAVKTNAMWRQAETEWPALLRLLEPGVVIVLGLSMWGEMPTTQVIVGDLVQGCQLENGRVAMCHAHKHASRGPGWEYYADVIEKALEEAKVTPTA